MRMGRRNKPFYRLVVADAKTRRDGKFVEIIGYYDPIPNPPEVKVDIERVLYWLSVGAQPTHAARSLLRKAGVLRKWHEVCFPPKGEGEAKQALEKEKTSQEPGRLEGESSGETPEREPASQLETQ